jgi:teichuronic acid biosynthesis glycosyltransferase TuaC
LEGVKCFPELLYYYNAADLFVMPSLSEGWGYVFGEAMLCGTPVIGTDTPGIRDAIANEACSILIKPNDPGALAEAIEKGLNKKWDREKVIEFALSFSWEKSIRKFEKIYEGLIAKL